MSNYDLPGKTILMHNRMGIRIELNFDRNGLLELWISPQAGSSLACRVRNFSNRDDHTRLFDRISLPGLSAASFVRCDYDPFCSTVHFTNQTLEIISLFDSPAVALRFKHEQCVDIKSDKEDSAVLRTANTFEILHPDRGLRFRYSARLGLGKGSFTHQLVLDTGRSTYCRATLAPGQTIAIAGGLDTEPVRAAATAATRGTWAALTKRNERAIAAALSDGTIRLRSNRQLQALVDTSRRVLLAMQDSSGAIRAALNRIYYLIWVRDGAIIECFNAYAGAAEPLEAWSAFLLHNPTEIKNEKPRGRTFGQLVNPISKWQEDGPFYAVWSAFTAWTQSDDKRILSKDHVATLVDSVDWLERYCFDSSRALFGRFYACESPFPGSRDDGHDSAVGIVCGKSDRKFNGSTVRRSYDVYINLFMYAAYEMLACALGDARAKRYREKSLALTASLERFFKGASALPLYGDIATDTGVFPAAPYSIDQTDYQWALSLPPFTPWPWRMIPIRQALLRDLLAPERSDFLAAYYSVAASCDPAHVSETRLMRVIEQGARESYRPGQFLPMPNAMREMTNVKDGDPWHDVRPQAFSIGPFLASLTGLGIRRLPFGLAVRPSRVLATVRDYVWHRKRLSFSFKPGPARGVPRVRVNARELVGSLQIPESLLTRPNVSVEITTVASARKSPMLISSTVRLTRVSANGASLQYDCRCYGHNDFEFTDCRGYEFRALVAGKVVPVRRHDEHGRTWVTIPGTGNCRLTVVPAEKTPG